MAEVLVVASKVKKYIKEQGMNTSASAIGALTEVVEKELDKAMDAAKKARRKTVMDKDFE